MGCNILSVEVDQDRWLDALMGLYGEPLTNIAYTYTMDWGKSQEIVQDVFIICYRDFHKRQTILNYKAWIYKITINRAKDYYKTSWVKRVLLIESLIEREPSPTLMENNLIASEKDAKLTESVLNLKEKYRIVILLYYYEELAVGEIASILSCNENTVKTRLKRGREQLKKMLGEEESHG
ncbi:RNA polymerase sigma-70 factor, ECF subfamily [Psychrobacillus sp. OK028]|uniref:sigma-70 family RNA polymerase sigma factor n=1 Tax=Psychrobacillus sp. OK028 TaxID=1884359 RepID=UPI000891774B|nr:sigma-70 family RNA polymerase sigma factor [Psychrobacillus sp. OK028]SDN27035.1 RNA polymerase sigma-70 factor, ECF subfamily [Psychrobacillus sp. OK028]